jgi:hypothetical protein
MARVQSNQTPEVLERYEEVVRLRSLGLSFQQIADRVGYAGRQGAMEAYKQAIKMWGNEAVEEMRTLENERIDHLWRTTIGQLERAQREQAEPETIMRIIATANNLSKRRSTLCGLDAPRQVELTGADGGAIETDIGQMLKDRLQQLQSRSVETIDIGGANTSVNIDNEP